MSNAMEPQPIVRATSSATPDALREQGCGRMVGRYTLLRRLAQGGMAEVHLARPITGNQTTDPDFGRPVAIKKILPQFSTNARFIEMLKDEAKITVALTHPNIAQVYELGLAGRDYFIVMEYVKGRPLNKLMQRADEVGLYSIPVPHSVHIMAEVVKGLDHAHRQTDAQGYNRGIVHRDVSPQNIIVAYSGEVKLIDFGIARAEGRVNQTQQGVIKGKLRYLAPEIAAGREPDHRADIYCCGIVLFEMLTGEAMFAPRSDMEAIELATQARVKSPRARNPNVPEALDAIVMRALRKDREERYGSAQELYVELIRFLREYEPTYLDGALGDFMRGMFPKEISQEETLNAAAAEFARSVPVEVTDEPTLAGEGAVYRQIVTRFEINPDEETVVADPLMSGREEAEHGRVASPVEDARPLRIAGRREGEVSEGVNGRDPADNPAAADSSAFVQFSTTTSHGTARSRRPSRLARSRPKTLRAGHDGELPKLPAVVGSKSHWRWLVTTLLTLLLFAATGGAVYWLTAAGAPEVWLQPESETEGPMGPTQPIVLDPITVAARRVTVSVARPGTEPDRKWLVLTEPYRKRLVLTGPDPVRVSVPRPKTASSLEPVSALSGLR